MKKLILPFAIASALFFSACSTKTEETQRDMIMLNDAQHQSSLNTDTAANAAIEPEEQAPPTPAAAPAPRQYREPVVQRTPTAKPRTTPVVTNQNTPPVVVNTPAPAPVETSTTGTSTVGDGTGTTDEKATEKKGGLSKAAQGAIIGGVGGAVGGAVIGKSGKGAIIGGVIGAAGGYILGRKKDKKDTSSSGN